MTRDHPDWLEAARARRRANIAAGDDSQPRAAAALRRALAVPVPDIAALWSALAAGAHPDTLCHNNHPALHVALHLRSRDAVRVLLAFGAAADVAARETAQRLCLESWLEAETNADAVPYRKKCDDELLRAVRDGTVEQVRQALAAGGDPNAAAPLVPYGPLYPALHHAFINRAADKALVLLQAGADIHARAEAGETVRDLLWLPDRRFGNEDWRALLDLCDRRGPRGLFAKNIDTLTVDDLRQPVPVAGQGGRRLMHALVDSGHAALVLAVLARDGKNALVADDFFHSVRTRYGLESFWEILGYRGQLQRFLGAEVWQGRLEEMHKVLDAVKKHPMLARTVKPAAATASIVRWRQAQLRRRGGPPGLRAP